VIKSDEAKGDGSLRGVFTEKGLLARKSWAETKAHCKEIIDLRANLEHSNCAFGWIMAFQSGSLADKW